MSPAVSRLIVRPGRALPGSDISSIAALIMTGRHSRAGIAASTVGINSTSSIGLAGRIACCNEPPPYFSTGRFGPWRMQLGE